MAYFAINCKRSSRLAFGVLVEGGGARRKASAARASAARAASIMCAGPRAAYELRAQLQVAVRYRCALSDVALASGVAQMKITIDETAAALQKWRYAEQCAARALTRTARLGFCRSVCGT